MGTRRDRPVSSQREDPRLPGRAASGGSEPLSPDDRSLELREAYHAVRNELLQPDRSIPVTRYFLDRWAPLLGPTLAAIVTRLRTCVADNRTARDLNGEDRDWRPAFPTQAELAAGVGVSQATVYRELKHPAARYFIKRIARYHYDERLKKKVRISDAYEVAMDDPPTPEDEKELAFRAAQRVIRAADPREARSASQSDSPPTRVPLHHSDNQVAASPTRQTDGQVRRRPPTRQSDGGLPLHVTNVNVHSVSNVTTRAEKRDPEVVRSLAEEMISQLGDESSREFYLRVAWRCPEEMIWAALSETKDAYLTGRIRKSRGACFTDLIKRKARERDVDL